MMLLRILIVMFIVAGSLDLLTKRSEKRSKKNYSKKKFIIRAPIDFIFLGTVGAALLIGVLLWGEITNQETHPALIWGAVITLGIPSFLLMIAPIKGLWDIRIDNDDITVVKCFIFKRHWKFSQIVRCKVTRGGTKIYVEGRRRKAFFVDGMCDGAKTFMKNIDKAGIPVEYPEVKEDTE